MRIKAALAIIFLIALRSANVSAQNLPDDIENIPAEDIGKAAIAFVNVSTLPGLSGSVIKFDDGARSSDLIRSGLGFAADFTLKNHIVDGFWGAAISYGKLDDNFLVDADVAEVKVERELISVRGSGGLSFPISTNLRLRTYLTLGLSRFDTESNINFKDTPDPPINLIAYSTEAASLAATAEINYSRWYGAQRLELIGNAAAIYTETFSASRDEVNYSATQTTMFGTARWSGATPWLTANRPWRWNAYATYVDFLGQRKAALGFTRYMEAGGGFEYEWNLKPLDFFGIRYIGLKAGYIFGDSLDGKSIGLTFR